MFLFIINIFLFIILLFILKNKVTINKENEQININLRKEKENLEEEISKQYKEITNIKEIKEITKEKIEEASIQYFKLLENEYDKKEKEYNLLIEKLENAYNQSQNILMENTEIIKKDLEKIKKTKAAMIEANLREKRLSEKEEFYSLKIKEEDLADIEILEDIKKKLRNKRILCMLIWSTFFQKEMNNLCNRVIGIEEKMGIYKITNKKTKECYIGQAVDIATRWKTHAKCGLGIDTPQNNKLYKAMQEYGIWNFTWEILEEIKDRKILNEKEQFYIEIYDSKNYGYNSTYGVK